MKLTVYKGFDLDFLSRVDGNPLVDNECGAKTDVLKFDKKTRKKLDMALLSMDDDDQAWMTYEEYALIKSRIDAAIEEDDLKIEIFRNNLFPDYYPLSFEMDEDLATEIITHIDGDSTNETSEAFERFVSVYNSLLVIDGEYYVSFYNYEYEKEDSVKVSDFYPYNITIEEGQTSGDMDVFLNDDIETYLRDLNKIRREKPGIIGLGSTEGFVARRIQLTLQAFCLKNRIRIVKFHESLSENDELENELRDIAKNDINIKGFKDFRSIKFYKNPDINKDIVELSQSVIIQEIIRQAENSYAESDGGFRDIFITASTGAGKSVMFQIPAIYLAKKYNKLTIIIEPVKALMQDQKEKLNKSGFMRVEAFNSDLITQVEKEAVLQRIKNGEVDLLYLSPETLLSYSIETIIGDRELGLLIVDEAHIVTTWGVGFRPDYWYLGAYINRLRNESSRARKSTERKMYHFPICAFTATAINGGIDDSVSDTVISLYMENPIKYIGYVRRDDIKFDIAHKESQKLPMYKYEEAKTKDLDGRIKDWLKHNTKTIVYFPYATMVGDAAKGIRAFAGITCDKRIGTYTGRNVDELSVDMFNATKRETFEKFRTGISPVMYATKAFGMGVDVDDVENVYHYAVTGNLCDYVQEIGRAARKKGIQGVAVTDNYYNDLTYMQRLFGMSQIRQYQVKKVLQGVYDTYKGKKGARSFLISPESFTYIFNGKGVQDESQCINKLKTCLMMLEKDFYDKYNFKVLISRPQSIFTKAFVVVDRNEERKVFNSKYGECFKFVEKGRFEEKQPDGSILSDTGDIYSIDLKKIWEDFHQGISFPQFKFWFFNASSTAKDKVEIMPEIRTCFAPRQKVTIEARGEFLLSDLRNEILKDFEYIANTLYSTYKKSYFTLDDFARLISEKYGMAKARIIVNSLFDLVDPNGYCVKHRARGTSKKTEFSLANGNFKELMRKPIIRSKIVGKISMSTEETYSSYMSLASDDKSNIALKLLSIFDYITYEVVGGEEPEIFIRLNDPNKVRDIVFGNIPYSNGYVTKAKQKHDRDVDVLLRFFNQIESDEERWDYIEDYFLGYDVLSIEKNVQHNNIPMMKAIDRDHSYPTTQFRKWGEIKNFFDENDHIIIDRISEQGIRLPEYLETSLKNIDGGEDILMCWASENVIICQQDVSDRIMSIFAQNGWKTYKFYEIPYEELKAEIR